MEPSSTPDSTVASESHIPSTDVSRLRVISSPDGKPVGLDVIGNDEAIYESHAAQLAAQAERQKEAEVNFGRDFCSRRFGSAPASDSVAQILAKFDAEYTGVQPAEFYRYTDTEITNYGYF